MYCFFFSVCGGPGFSRLQTTVEQHCPFEACLAHVDDHQTLCEGIDGPQVALCVEPCQQHTGRSDSMFVHFWPLQGSRQDEDNLNVNVAIEGCIVKAFGICGPNQ